MEAFRVAAPNGDEYWRVVTRLAQTVVAERLGSPRARRTFVAAFVRTNLATPPASVLAADAAAKLQATTRPDLPAISCGARFSDENHSVWTVVDLRDDGTVIARGTRRRTHHFTVDFVASALLAETDGDDASDAFAAPS